MKIGIMCHSSFGGSARIGTWLATHLAGRGHTVHLFTRTVPFGSWDPDTGVILHRIVPEHKDTFHPTMLHAIWPLEEYRQFLEMVLGVISREELDVLHFHYAVPFASIAEKVRRHMGEKAPVLIGTLHGTDVTVCGRDPSIGPSLTRALKALNVVTTVSHSHADVACEVFEFHQPPEIIPNFVDLSRFRPLKDFFKGSRMAAPGSRTVDQDPPERTITRGRIVHVSNFRPVKDLDCLAQIFIEIRRRIDAELWLVGDGQDMERIERILKRTGVEKDVYFWGIRRDVAPILAQADVFLLSSRWESFSLAALEAMACGVPVVAPRTGGLPEVVPHGQVGFLYPVGDPDTAAEYVTRLLNHPGELRTMGEAAARHARKYDAETIVGTYETLYHELLVSGKLPFDTALAKEVKQSRESIQSRSIL